MEKRKPHYALSDIKAAFGDSTKLNRSFASRQGADALQMDDEAVVGVIQKLAATDFDRPHTPIVGSGRTYTDQRLARRRST